MTTTIALPAIPVAGPPNTTPLMTAEEFYLKYEHRHAELVKGVVKEQPMPDYRHGKACIKAGRFLDEFVSERDLGHVSGVDAFVKIPGDPPTVRGADVCFLSYDRLPRGEVPVGLLDAVPELVFEVRSPTNTWIGLIAKALDYFSAGVRVVVVLDPSTRSAAVYRPDARTDIFEADQELIFPDVLPGFAVPVRKFFE